MTFQLEVAACIWHCTGERAWDCVHVSYMQPAWCSPAIVCSQSGNKWRDIFDAVCHQRSELQPEATCEIFSEYYWISSHRSCWPQMSSWHHRAYAVCSSIYQHVRCRNVTPAQHTEYNRKQHLCSGSSPFTYTKFNTLLGKISNGNLKA